MELLLGCSGQFCCPVPDPPCLVGGLSPKNSPANSEQLGMTGETTRSFITEAHELPRPLTKVPAGSAEAPPDFGNAKTGQWPSPDPKMADFTEAPDFEVKVQGSELADAAVVPADARVQISMRLLTVVSQKDKKTRLRLKSQIQNTEKTQVTDTCNGSRCCGRFCAAKRRNRTPGRPQRQRETAA